VISLFLGGVLPVFSDSFTVMLIWRGVLGFGAGLTRVFAMSWSPIFFKGRSRDIMRVSPTASVVC
jgi:MFS family permease